MTAVTSSLYWLSTLVAAAVDLPLLFVLARYVRVELFRRLKWYLAGAAFLVYAFLWGVVCAIIYWQEVYSLIFPAWSRSWLPLFYGILFGLLALGSWRLCVGARKWQVVWFCLCGGAISLAGHAVGISRGLMRVPLLAQVSLTSALVFGIFEFIFYWCIIVGLGIAARWVVLKLRPPAKVRA